MQQKAQDDELIMSLVEMALAQPKDERRAYLRQACAGEDDLFSQVWKYVEQEDRMNGFLLDPLYPPLLFEHSFEPGELLDGRFRIVREVAQGGMGIVYEAIDEKLQRRIALKTAKTGFRHRLTPEVRHASDISHPNVCKIFEIHTASTKAGDIDFLTMEFLEGETLAQKLRRGALPEREARIIARQLCEGLAEAHRNMVIHGDLKSSNVILPTSAGGAVRAVITDFGLAHTARTAQRTTQSGQEGGTPDYMAPELWQGEKATAGSDIYALGVILCELISGRRPEIHTGDRIARPPAAVPPKWDRIIRRCIDRQPSRRFRDAAEIARAFAPPATRRWFLTAAAAAVLAVASGAVTYQRATSPGESVQLAMLPLASTQDLTSLGARASRDTADQLARIKGSSRTSFVALPPANAVRAKVDTVSKARTALGATHVLHGTLVNENGKVILHEYVTDTRTMVNVKDWKAVYAPEEVRYIPAALAAMVTGTFRLPPLAPITAELAVKASALKDYLEGMSYVRRNSGVDLALASLQRAVAADPDSPLTHAGLAEAQWFKYYFTKDPVFLAAATESVRQAQIRNLDLPQVHRVAGILHANSGWYELAAAEYRRTIDLDPGNSDAYRRLGQAHERNNQLDDALAAFRKAVEMEPEYYRNHQALGTFYNHQSRYLEAFPHFQRMVETATGEPEAHFAFGTAYSNLGKFPEAEAELRISLRLGESPTAMQNLATVLMRQSKDQEAIPLLVQAVEKWPSGYQMWMDLGIAYRRVGLKAESAKANRQALYFADKEMTRDPRNGRTRSHLAYLCAALGDASRAESDIAQALQLSPKDHDTRWMAAATYELLGRRDATLDVLRASPKEVLVELSRWPDLADLSKDSRFIQLLASQEVN